LPKITVRAFKPSPVAIKASQSIFKSGQLAKVIKNKAGLSTTIYPNFAYGRSRFKTRQINQAELIDFGRQTKSNTYFDWHDFSKELGVDIGDLSDNQFKQSAESAINRGGKLFFDLRGVDIEAAKSGGLFMEGGEYFPHLKTLKLTDYELSHILRNEKFLKNTFFYDGKNFMDADEAGFKLIDDIWK
jgi:hypothetical protein